MSIEKILEEALNGYTNKRESEYMEMFKESLGIKKKDKPIVNCPNCDKKLKVIVGKKNRCPSCKHEFTVKTK